MIMDFAFGIVGVLTAVLPGAIVAQHALYLRLIRKRSLDDAATPPTPGEPAWREARAREARVRVEREFSLRVLFVRYWLPALLLVIVGAVLFFVLWRLPADLKPLDQPLWFGGAGAYVYVLLLLTQRNFRRDITSGVAWWCAATLLLGPMLAAAVGSAWALEGPAPDNAHWAKSSLYFLAGLTPRSVAESVQEIFRRLWLSGSAAAAPSGRSSPISQVRGILPSVEDRLAEEGVLDVSSLAMADPHKLLRNTSFDPRTLLNWMDEAMLMVVLPKYWQDLEAEGVTGAIDLAWYAAGPGAERDAELQGLAQKVHLDLASLKSTVQRLFEDAQLQLIWVLYQSDSDDPDGQGGNEGGAGGEEAPPTTDPGRSASGGS